MAHNLYQRILMLYAAPYVQDDWKVNRRLTLNLGVRFDYYGHLSTVENSQQPLAFFTPGAGSTGGADPQRRNESSRKQWHRNR